MLVKQTQSDFEIIDEILNGNKNLYGQLIRRYNQKLYRIAKGILWEEDFIEDVLQDTYIKGFQSLTKFERKSSFSTWITRILINECLMKHRNTRRNKEESFQDQLQMMIDNSTPEKRALNKELKGLLEEAIQHLSEKYRVVFVMREVEGMSVLETSQSLDLTEGNVKARLSRAKEMLRERLTSVMPLNELLEFNLIRCDRITKNVLSKISG